MRIPYGRTCRILPASLLLASVAGGQTLDALKPGTLVRVTAPRSLWRTMELRLGTVGPDSVTFERASLSYHDSSGNRPPATIARADIQQLDVYRVTGSRAVQGMLTGAIVGSLSLGAYGYFGKSSCERRPGCWDFLPPVSVIAFVGGLVGGSIGAGVGVALKKGEWRSATPNRETGRFTTRTSERVLTMRANVRF
jgi:hypothetical protein